MNKRIKSGILTGLFLFGAAAFFISCEALAGDIEELRTHAPGFIPSFTVTFNSNGGTTTVKSQTVTMDGFAAVPDTEPYRGGYSFQGWYKNEACSGDPWLFAIDAVTEPVTLYAKWIEGTNKHAVFVYYGNGHDPDPEITNNLSHEYSFLIPADQTRTGYNFGGWYAENQGGKLTSGGTIPITCTLAIYAKWNPLAFTVNYNANGGAGTQIPPSNHAFDEEKPLSKNTYTRSGYTFIGWNTQADGGGDSFDDLSTKNTASVPGNVTLYAMWARLIIGGTNTALTVTLDSAGTIQNSSVIFQWKFKDNVEADDASCPIGEDDWLKDYYVTAGFSGLEKILESDYWRPVSTLAHLETIDTSYANWTSNYILLTDISDPVTKPICEGNTNGFGGIFDGNGRKIKLKIIDYGQLYCGLFGNIEGGTVKNLRLSGEINISASSSSRNTYAGAAAGFITKSGTIRNISSDTSVVSATSIFSDYIYLGGIAGLMGSGAKIENCYVTGSVKGKESISALNRPHIRIGGISGSAGVVNNCWASGDINIDEMFSDDAMVGGIAGSVGREGQSNSIIDRCVALQSIIQGLPYFMATPRFTGKIAGTSVGVISSCYANSGMSITSGNGEKGADVSLANANTSTWWTGTAGWTVHNSIGEASEEKPWVWSGAAPPSGIPVTRPALWFELPSP